MKNTENFGSGGFFKMRIALVSREDLPRIAVLERESHVDPWSETSFREELHRPFSHFWVARLCRCAVRQKIEGLDIETSNDSCDNRPDLISGYICCWLVADELQILNVTVDKKWRRHGIGKALLSHALEWGRAHQACAAVLEVRKSNLAAQLLYKSMGFHTVGERPDYYGVVKEAAVLMGRVISDE
jgi:ribosomal-protein-alanine N-acetyltransferase